MTAMRLVRILITRRLVPYALLAFRMLPSRWPEVVHLVTTFLDWGVKPRMAPLPFYPLCFPIHPVRLLFTFTAWEMPVWSCSNHPQRALNQNTEFKSMQWT